MDETRQLYIISGCNGAGKTTASYTVLPEILLCKEFVNADEIAKGLSPFNPESMAIEAGRPLPYKREQEAGCQYRLRIRKHYCCEGLEGVQITLNDGDISIVASDDGINAADGSSSSGMGIGGFGGGQTSSSDSSILLTINGGNIFVNAGGDGLDSNGNIVMNGGNVTVLGPTSDGDTALDFDGAFTINGGVLMAFGSSGMLETPTSAQNGCCIVTTLGTVSANSAFSLTDSSGNVIMSYTPTKNYASAIVYSSDIKSGSTYTVTAGSTTQSITVNSNVTTNGVSGGFGGGQNGGFGGGQRGGQPGGSAPDGNGSFGGGQRGGNQQGGMPGGNSMPDYL